MLKPETDHVWQCLREQPALAGFVLIGGTALTLHIGHRLSEDLDFACLLPKLPRARLRALIQSCAGQGVLFRANDDAGAVDDFEISGMDLHDHQQDFLVNGVVKVSFFCPEAPLHALLESREEHAGVRIAMLRELFQSKAILTASRSKTRDWFDLYILMQQHGFTMKDFYTAYVQAGIPNQYDLGIKRLCSGHPQASDEGYEALVKAAPSVAELQQFFLQKRDDYERAKASSGI
ncbi:hypothetical protein BH11VER1_BH11VER1_26800 [soil metagenome]